MIIKKIGKKGKIGEGRREGCRARDKLTTVRDKEI